MNSYYKAANILKSIIEDSKMVNTIIHGGTGELDTYKKAISPIAHINPIGRDFSSSQQNTYIFEIAVLDQRNISKFSEEDRFEGNDNEIDNLNLTDYVINYVVSKLRNQRTGLELINTSTATPLILKHTNLLDGWLIQITVAVENTMITTC